MNSLRKIFLNFINLIGRAIPRKTKRFIADFPGILRILEILSNRELIEISTPEGTSLLINPLFHSTLIRSGDLRDYEPGIRKIIMKFTKPGMTAYDVGANVGVFSFLFASIVGNDGIVYSFEPEKNNYTCFQKSLEKYKTENIYLDKRAVGKSKNTETFDRRGGAFSGRLIGNASYCTTSNTEIVETVSIDYLIREEEYRIPDILKIDVEGNEGMVLEGMKTILDNYNPIVICELHSHLGESTEPIINLLSSYGYTISNVEGALSGNGFKETASNVSTEKHIIAVKHIKNT